MPDALDMRIDAVGLQLLADLVDAGGEDIPEAAQEVDIGLRRRSGRRSGRCLGRAPTEGERRPAKIRLRRVIFECKLSGFETIFDYLLGHVRKWLSNGTHRKSI